MLISVALSVAACVSVTSPSASPPPSQSAPSTSTPATASPTASSIPPTTPSPPPPTATPTAIATASPSAQPTPTTQPTQALAISGRIAFVGLGFAVTLPESWLRLDYEDRLVRFYTQAGVVEPDLGSICESQGKTVEECLFTLTQQVQTSLQSAGIPDAEAALNLHSVGNYVPTFALFLKVGAASGTTIEDGLVAAKRAVKGLAKGRVTSGFVQVQAGTAGYLYYTISTFNLDLRIRQFLIIGNGNLYSLAVEGATTDDALPESADALISSFELLAP
jgi:hypothetical protein